MVRITLIQKRVFLTKDGHVDIEKNLENAKKELDKIARGSKRFFFNGKFDK